MRITAVLMLVFCLQVSAEGLSQKITFNARGISVKNALEQVEKQTDHFVVYNQLMLGKNENRISLKVTNMSLRDYLDLVLRDTDLDFIMENKTIILTQKSGAARPAVVYPPPVKGVVRGADGTALSGASVNVKGGTAGTKTDENGMFTIDAEVGQTLIVTFVGFNPQEVTITGTEDLNISLAPLDNKLESVVVVGYGTQKKRDLTGSIASVSGDEVARMPATNPMASLQGKVAGLTIANSGRAGSSPVVRIRGVNSTNTANPVYVVDGMLVDNIDFLNPMDIESMDILKDPSSIAIYGLRAANGVIAVTTKAASRGKTRVSIQSVLSVQKVQDKIKVTDAAGFKKLYQAQEESMNVPAIDRFDFTNFTANTDWQDLIFQNALMTANNISVANSGEKTTTYLNIGYTNQEGVLKNDSYKRFLLHLKEEIRISKSIKVGGDISGYHANFNPPAASITHALWAAPIFPVQVDETTFYSPPSFQSSSISNPVAYLKRDDRNSVNKNYRVLGNVFAEIKLPYNLTWRSTVYGDLNFFTNRRYTRLPFNYINLSTGETTHDANARTSVTQVQGETQRYQQDHTLSYDGKFGDGHSLTAVAGVTTVYNTGSVVDVTAKDNSLFIPDNPDYWYLPIITDPAVTINAPNTRNLENSMFGSFLRAAYSFRGRYLLNATVRRDGSSKFDSKNRWATSASLGVGWVISQEDFFKEVSFINFLKIRGAWGRLANSNGIPDNLFRPGLKTGQGAIFGDNIYPSIVAAFRPDPNIGYEIVGGYDAGFDIRLLDNRLNAEFSIYNRTTSNILTNITLPNLDIPYTTNLGKITNKGFEVSMGWKDNISEDFTYNIAGNFSYNKNIVNSIGDGFDFQLVGNGGINLTKAGQSIGHFFGYRQVGIYQSTADLVHQPSFATSLPGDIAYADVSGNGSISSDDREYLGSPFPAYNFGGAITLNYKGIDLMIEGQGQAGHKIYAQRRAANFTALNFVANRLNAWTGSGTTNVEPIMNNSRANNFLFSTYYLEPGDYFRIRTLQLGYNFTPALLSRVGIYNARIYVSGQNIKTWSKVTGYSPEPLIGGILDGGADNGAYPVPAVYSLGVNLTF